MTVQDLINAVNTDATTLGTDAAAISADQQKLATDTAQQVTDQGQQMTDQSALGAALVVSGPVAEVSPDGSFVTVFTAAPGATPDYITNVIPTAGSTPVPSSPPSS